MRLLLIIDDEPDFGEFVARVAEAAGFEAVVTDNVKDFRREAKARHPAVVIMDLQMPDVDGIELLREMRGYCADADIILASGMDTRVLDMTVRLGKALGLRMARSVQKPVRVAELKALLIGLHRPADNVTPSALQEAIQSDRLFLAFQPKHDAMTHRMTGVEALVRWKDPLGRVIFPDAFIPVAEEFELMGPLTRWVAAHAIDQAGIWRAKGLCLDIALNVSGVNMREGDLPDFLADRCRSAGVPTQTVTLELTETASAQDGTKLMEILGRFRLKDFNLAIDDFGTGYSSISQLVRLPFSELKVDKSFVMAMDRETDSAIVAKAVIELGHSLNLKVTAEGVETESALKTLQSYGCDVVQGYYFSKPVPEGEIEAQAARSVAAA